MPGRRIKFLTGAPEARSLDWSEDTLSTNLMPAFQPPPPAHHNNLPDPSIPSTAPAKWRHIPLDGKLFYETPGRPSATTTTKLFPSLIDDESSFLDQSLALLESLHSSQLAAHDPSLSSTLDDESSFLSSTLDDPSFLSSTSPLAPLPRFPASSHITPLAALPTASHIHALRPQTLTATLVAGVVSVSAPRRVHVRRRGGYDMDVVEAVLGDETRAGFAVTAWLAPPAAAAAGAAAADAGLRTAVEGLRMGDVVLWERLALAACGGVVFGQTLGWRGSGGTRVLKVTGEMEGDVGGKVARVREWVENFVGVARGEKGDKKGKRRAVQEEGQRRSKRLARESFLPDDTQ